MRGKKETFAGNKTDFGEEKKWLLRETKLTFAHIY